MSRGHHRPEAGNILLETIIIFPLLVIFFIGFFGITYTQAKKSYLQYKLGIWGTEFLSLHEQNAIQAALFKKASWFCLQNSFMQCGPNEFYARSNSHTLIIGYKKYEITLQK